MTATVQTESLGSGRVGTWVRGKYLVEAVLGSGGMATVYAARHRNKKRVALKMLHPEFSGNADVQARFLREGYVANTVDHPGAVAVLDEDVTEDGSAFLVMELLHGASLETISEGLGGMLSLEAVLAAAYQTLEVLVAAHAKNVVHRDIKPANLFLTRDGRIKVLDYGIARLREADASTTRTGTSMGTPAFMAPEQAAGKTSQVDEQSDLWSLGATMFTLLTNKFVYEGETPQHMMVLAATVPPRSLSSAASVPALAAALIDQALAFDKSARWASAAAMRDAVAEVQTALFDRAITAAPLLELAARNIPQSMRPPSLLGDAARMPPQPTPSTGRPVVAGLGGPPLEATVHALTPAPAVSKRRTPLWVGGAVILTVAAALSLRQRPAVAPIAAPSSTAPAATTTPTAALGSSSPTSPVGSAAPPPTGAVTDPPVVASAAPPPASASAAPRPALASQPARAQPKPSKGAVPPVASGAAPNDFDRQ